MTWGVFLTRAQPFHNGHLEIIKQMLKENDNVLVIIGSSNKQNTLRNPFNIETRYHLVYQAIYNFGPDNNRIKLMTLPDWSSEDFKPAVKEWGKFLYYNIVSKIETKSFNFYYNDDISIITDWFDDILLNRITIKQTDRTEIMNGVSSTKVRESLLNNDKDYFIKHTSFSDLIFEYLRDKYIKVYHSPDNDSMMK